MQGLCGKEIMFKYWKQGRSYKCKDEGVTVIHWGKSHQDHSEEAIRILCNFCRKHKDGKAK